MYILFEVHYINNHRYLSEKCSSNDLDYLIKLKKVLSDKYVNTIYRIYEVII